MTDSIYFPGIPWDGGDILAKGAVERKGCSPERV
jgi:hypothetical protein